MCELSYTSYRNCGCARVHATLPCPMAFFPCIPKCEPKNYIQREEVDGDCPECKPAFDNKSGLKPLITLNFTRNTPRPIMQEVHQVQLKGTFAEIDQQHNQFRHLDHQARENHKAQLFLDWLDDPEHRGPRKDGVDECDIAWCQEKREIARASRAGQEDHMGKITPSPPPTPSTTTTEVVSVSVRDEYTLKARHHVLTASQRRALCRRGHDNIRRLSVVSRHHHHSNDTSSDEYALEARRHTLSASQRAAMHRAGRGNIRKLSVVGPRRRPQPCY